jgi:hypothetical protein
MQMLEAVEQQRVLREAGASLFGPSAQQWPAWFFDAWTVVSNQIVIEQTLRLEEREREMKRGRNR